MVVKLNTVRLNGASLNSASLNGVGERLRASAGGGGGEVIPPEEPDVPDVPVTYILSASASNGVVSASVNGNAVTLPYTANEGDVVVVEVTANDGYEFDGWSDGSTDNPRSITMTADVTLSATCVVKAVEKEYIQFADPAVEAVLMANGVSSDGVGITMEDAAKVTSIGTTWFYQNTEITSFNELKYFTGVTAIKANASTGKGSFEGCTSLTSIAFPPSLTSVGQRAFLGCSALSNVENIEVLKTIALNAFYNCTSLAFEELNLENLTSLGQNALYGVKIKKLNLGKVTSLPSAINTSQNYGDKSVLEEVVLPEGLTTIPGYSFYQYSVLSSINLDNIVEVSPYAVEGVAVPKMIFSDGFTKIGLRGASKNTALTLVDFPSTTTSIGDSSFVYCSALATVICRATTPPSLVNNAFGAGMSTAAQTPIALGTGVIYVPDASLEAYKTATNWSQYSDRIHPLSEIEGSPYITFADPEVERVLMENNVSSDGVGITMADAEAVTSIGTWFKGNKEITSFNELEYFSNVKWLHAEAFSGCTSLQSISLKNIESTGYDALKQTALSHVDAPLLGFVNNYAFTEISSDFSINLPSCTTIYKNGFYKSGLQKISCTNLLEIQDNGLKDTRLKEIFLPNVKTIGIDGLNLCPYLAKVDIGGNATSIGNFAFGNSTSLETLIVRATTPPSAGRLILENTAIDSANGFIYVPDASVDAYKAASGWSTYASRIKPLSEYVES